MTLHEAIEKVLRQTGRQMTTQQIADELNKNGWYQKKDGSIIHAFQIHGRTRNYTNIFERDGSIVSLCGQGAVIMPKSNSIILNKQRVNDTAKAVKDEHYVLDLCDKILGLTSSRQHRFDFLLGDMNNGGTASRLPVDSYYDKLKLVVEYREKQHTESVHFFDKPDQMTVSGVHRGEQRKIYDERRRQVLPEHQITLIEFSYSDFNYDKQKRIIQNMEFDMKVVRNKLIKFL